METEKALVKLAFAMDKAMEAYEANEDTIFANEVASQKFRYDSKYVKSLSWGNNNICIYKGCTEQAIRASHTIQKSTSLSSIAEDRHVLAPRFNYRRENYNLSLVGVNDASTFPDFCSAHERIFGRFEDKKDFIDEQDFRLQIYRTICREIIQNRRSLDSSVYRKDQYTKFRDETLNELIKKEAQNQNIDLNSLTSFKHKRNDGRIKFMANHVKKTNHYLDKLDKLHDAIFNDITKNKVQKIYFDAINMDWVIPCSLAGKGGIVVKTKSKLLVVDVILNVLPYEDKTYVIIATHHKYKIHLKEYLNRFMQHPFSMITMVESWMLYGSDHWFVRPSVWENLDKSIQKELIDEMFSEKNINAISPHFIFKELRLALEKLLEI